MAVKVQKNAPDIIIRLDNNEVGDCQVLEVGHSLGGRSLDYAELQFIQFPTGELISANTSLLAELPQVQCEVYVGNENGGNNLIHFGFIDARTISIGREEVQRVMSRLQPYHFGEPIHGMRVWSPLANDSRQSEEQIVFNPQLDGRVANNLSNRADPQNGSLLFIHPECQRSTNSLATNGGVAAQGWSLAGAAHYLCWNGNPAQTYFQNPTLLDVLNSLPSDPNFLRNHVQPFGEYLPANLDALLEPYGYAWKVDLSNPAAKKIVIFKRGFTPFATPLLKTKLAKVGKQVDFKDSNTEEIHITADVTNRLTNHIAVYGDTIQIEGTFELVPAWDPIYDSYTTTPENLRKLDLHGGDQHAWDTEPALARVWRDWVLNEAGDYTGLRPSIPGFYNFNLVTTLGLQFMARRRKFLPCLTIGADGAPIGQHHGCVVEFYKLDSNTAQTTGSEFLATGNWIPVDEMSEDACHIQILEKECGIRFAGPKIPKLLVKYGLARTKVRVTATVEMDKRLIYKTIPTASPNTHTVGRVIDMGSRFKARIVLLSGKHSAGVVGGTLFSTAVNDYDKAEKLAKELLANWNQASVSGGVTLPGVDWDLGGDPLGKAFYGIEGREISFQTTAPGMIAKYPSVTAVKWDFVNQKTTLTLDTWRRDA